MIVHADSAEYLKTVPDNTYDAMITDPPYGYSFMNRDWDDGTVPSSHWAEVYRTMKPGAFACIMSAPRSDVLAENIMQIKHAGFNVAFTPVFWAYSTGFPKYARTDLKIDARLNVKSKVVGRRDMVIGRPKGARDEDRIALRSNIHEVRDVLEAGSPEGRKMAGSILGFQPKPVVEPIIIAMKPTRGGYLDQAIKDGHGVTWIDGARIPFSNNETDKRIGTNAIMTDNNTNKQWRWGKKNKPKQVYENGRFPANVLVSDGGTGNESFDSKFDLDAWAAQFIITPKASRSEKEKGLSLRDADTVDDGRIKVNDTGYQRGDTKRHNTHPTVKPIKLMSYLVELFSRPGHTVLDPFAGSGTTGIACQLLGRPYTGIERDKDYCDIAMRRLNHWAGRRAEKAQSPGGRGLDSFLDK